MKSIIGGLEYDTDNAERLCCVSKRYGPFEDCETLYRTKKGRLFVMWESKEFSCIFHILEKYGCHLRECSQQEAAVLCHRAGVFVDGVPEIEKA